MENQSIKLSMSFYRTPNQSDMMEMDTIKNGLKKLKTEDYMLINLGLIFLIDWISK